MDLAIISAGETDMETTRITCLHTSCLGFAPLIFDLQPSFGFDELMRTCEPVWSALDADPTLPKKLVGLGIVLSPLTNDTKTVEAILCKVRSCQDHGMILNSKDFFYFWSSRMLCTYTCSLPKCIIFGGRLFFIHMQMDTNRHMEWLQSVKTSHGSVAVSSLMEAQTINEHGIYCVGCGDESSSIVPEQLTLDNVIQLTLPTGENGKYSLDNLKDLQSKLMLIAAKPSQGKDLEQVNRFVAVSLEWSLFHY